MGMGVNLSEAESVLGLSPGALWHWVNRNKYRTTKIGKERIAHIKILDAYEAKTNPQGIPRVDARPYGYVSIEEAVAQTGISTDSFYKAINQGKLNAVRQRAKFYIEPTDLEDFVLRFKNYPLPGWVHYRPVAIKNGAKQANYTRWLERNGYETRKYRNRASNINARHCLQEALDHLLRDYGSNCPNYGYQKKDVK